MKLLRVLSLPWRALAAHRSSRRTVIGGFVPVAPHPRCIDDMPRYVANWTAKYGRKLRARVLQQTTSAPRITNIPPLSPARLKAARAANYGGTRVVALPSVTPQRIDQLREQLSTPAQNLAAAVRHTRNGTAYAALEIDNAHS